MVEITPAGLVLTAANDRVQRAYPFAYQFNMMCQQAIMGDEAATLPELTATRKLEDHEGAAVNVVFSALLGAANSGSIDAIMGVATFGLPLIAKWAQYLVVIEQHPDLDFSRDDES
ncbi:MAG: hypothetical protein WD473_02330 [Acidimicrobiia bacterium]